MKRVVWLDLVRIFSIFFVIVIHITAIDWYAKDPTSFGWNILNIYDSISRFCVPVFLMISGALFLSKKNIDIKKLYTKNIMRLVVALMFWAFIYAIVSNWRLLNNFSLNNFFIIVNSFNKINYHLRFLLSLIGVYIFIPLIKKVTEDEKLFKYLLIISIIFSIIIPTINITFDYLNYFGGYNPFYQLYYSLTNWLFKIHIPFVSGYLTFFLTGYKLFKDPIKNKKLIYLLGVISLLFTVLATAFVSIKYNTPVEAYYSYNTINVYLLAIAVFVFFKEEVSKIKFNDKVTRFIKILSDSIFGIYLIHVIFIIFIKDFNLLPLNMNYILAVPLFSLIVFIMSFIAIYLIRKIPKVHKYIT